MFITKIEIAGDSGRRYDVSVGPQGAQCTCPDFEHRGQERGICKHIDYVALKVFGLQRREEPTVRPSLVLVSSEEPNSP
jgi:uncharacterized Zn finger protein